MFAVLKVLNQHFFLILEDDLSGAANIIEEIEREHHNVVFDGDSAVRGLSFGRNWKCFEMILVRQE